MTPRLVCPCCGAKFALERLLLNGEHLIRRMWAAHSPPANVYLGRDGGYYIEYGGGEVSRSAIEDALRKGLIVPAWEHKPDAQYWKPAMTPPADSG